MTRTVRRTEDGSFCRVFHALLNFCLARAASFSALFRDVDVWPLLAISLSNIQMLLQDTALFFLLLV